MISHRNVARAFADGETKTKGSRMFIEGDTVYSYGRHYPIAMRHFKDGIHYLVNVPYGSLSTGRHRSYLLQEISGSCVLVVEGCSLDNAPMQIRNNEHEIGTAKKKLSIERKEHMKERYIEKIEELEAQQKILKFHAAKNRLMNAAERESNGAERK